MDFKFDSSVVLDAWTIWPVGRPDWKHTVHGDAITAQQAAKLAAEMLDRRIRVAKRGMVPRHRRIVVSDGVHEQTFSLKQMAVLQWVVSHE